MSEDIKIINADEAENVDLKLRLISLSRKINDEIIDHAFRLVKELLKIRKKTVSGAKISILGISGYFVGLCAFDRKQNPISNVKTSNFFMINLFSIKEGGLNYW